MLRNIFENTQDSLQQELLKGQESWWGTDSLQKPSAPNTDTTSISSVWAALLLSGPFKQNVLVSPHVFLPASLKSPLMAVGKHNHRWKVKKSCTHIIWKLIQLLEVVHLKCIREHLIKYLHNSHMSTFASNTFISEEISWKDTKFA